jgi:hypothetical protein
LYTIQHTILGDGLLTRREIDNAKASIAHPNPVA